MEFTLSSGGNRREKQPFNVGFANLCFSPYPLLNNSYFASQRQKSFSRDRNTMLVEGAATPPGVNGETICPGCRVELKKGVRKVNSALLYDYIILERENSGRNDL